MHWGGAFVGRLGAALSGHEAQPGPGKGRRLRWRWGGESGEAQLELLRWDGFGPELSCVAAGAPGPFPLTHEVTVSIGLSNQGIRSHCVRVRVRVRGGSTWTLRFAAIRKELGQRFCDVLPNSTGLAGRLSATG